MESCQSELDSLVKSSSGDSRLTSVKIETECPSVEQVAREVVAESIKNALEQLRLSSPVIDFILPCLLIRKAKIFNQIFRYLGFNNWK